MKVTKEITIAMGHSVTGHKSKCRGLHGHDYRIIATVDDKIITTQGASDEGMVIDFGDLKQAMMDTIDRYYDHGFIIYEGDVRAPLLKQATDLWCFEKERFHIVDFIPTAENLAKHWFKELSCTLSEKGIRLCSLQVYETPTSSAIYEPVTIAEDLLVQGTTTTIAYKQ